MTMNNCWNFMAGVGCGVAVGLLVAPKAGVELRSQIAGKVSDGQQAVKDTVTETVGDFKGAIQRRLAIADQTIKEGVPAYDEERDVYLNS